VLSEAEGVHLIRLSRLDPNTGRAIRYRIMYQIRDQDLIVIVINAAALPAPSRRRPR
jgi:hypothetical protein